MTETWYVYGMYMVSVWYVYCMYIVRILYVYGMYMVCIWYGYGMCMVCIWMFPFSRGHLRGNPEIQLLLIFSCKYFRGWNLHGFRGWNFDAL